MLFDLNFNGIRKILGEREQKGIKFWHLTNHSVSFTWCRAYLWSARERLHKKSKVTYRTHIFLAFDYPHEIINRATVDGARWWNGRVLEVILALKLRISILLRVYAEMKMFQWFNKSHTTGEHRGRKKF